MENLDFLTQLNPTILITAIVLNSAGLIYALWILRQQSKETIKLMENHINHNTEAMTELQEMVKKDVEFTKTATQLTQEVLNIVKNKNSS